jgi:hypothetical protein
MIKVAVTPALVKARPAWRRVGIGWRTAEELRFVKFERRLNAALTLTRNALCDILSLGERRRFVYN